MGREKKIQSCFEALGKEMGAISESLKKREPNSTEKLIHWKACQIAYAVAKNTKTDDNKIRRLHGIIESLNQARNELEDNDIEKAQLLNLERAVTTVISAVQEKIDSNENSASSSTGYFTI